MAMHASSLDAWTATFLQLKRPKKSPFQQIHFAEQLTKQWRPSTSLSSEDEKLSQHNEDGEILTLEEISDDDSWMNQATINFAK